MPAIFICASDEGDECDAWATYHRFDAKAYRVISGSLPDQRFPVIFGRHALGKRNFRNVIALLERLEPDNPYGVEYRIRQWGQKRDMVCFEYRDFDAAESAVELNGDERLNCFDRN